MADIDCICCCGCDHTDDENYPAYGPPAANAQPSPPRPAAPTSLKAPTFVRVYVLGVVNDRTVIEQFSGQDGLHIRTIHEDRFNNPVSLGAGAGYLAVVDRYGDRDLIRVTDKYAGAGPEGFDVDGFPKDDVNWGGINDIIQIDTHGYGEVSGVQILPRGILIATLNAGNGIPTFVRYDLDGGYPFYSGGVFTLVPPFDTAGNAVGIPSAVDQSQLNWLHQFSAVIDSPSGKMLATIDYVRKVIISYVGLPNETIYGIAESKPFLTVFAGDANHIAHSYRLRRAATATSAFLTDPGSSAQPSAPNRTVVRTGEPLDLPGGLNIQYTGGSVLNRRFGEPASPHEDQDDPAAAILGGRLLSPPQTAFNLNSNRLPIESSYHTGVYGFPVSVPASLIENPVSTEDPVIVGMAGQDNTVAELTRYLLDGEIDNEKSLFRLVHGSFYDYLSDGGFTYGCVRGETGETVPVTSGLNPRSIAIDRSTEHGKLKPLPDVKVALIDIRTGLRVYGTTKNYGYNFYGGLMASLRLSDESARAVRTTVCTQDALTLQESYDGLGYTYKTTTLTNPDGTPTQVVTGQITEIVQSGTYPESIFGTTDSRLPWALMLPRVTPGKIVVQPYDSKPTWTREDHGSGPKFDWWLGDYIPTIPAVTITSTNQMYVGPKGQNTEVPIFDATVRGGFFGLNWPKNRVDSFDGDGNLQVAFVTPASILDYKINGADVTPAGDALIPEAVSGSPAVNAYQIGSGLNAHRDLVRAVGFDPDIRSWIGIDVALSRDGTGLVDGNDVWILPESYENGLGLAVGSSGYTAATENLVCKGGASGGTAYEYAHYAGDGAAGVWQIDVFANGEPINQIATQVTYPEQLTMAPEEAQGILNATFFAAGGVNPLYGYRKGHVYFSKDIIRVVTIKARLYNYAYSVYRGGYHTIDYGHPDYLGQGVLCSGADPGFYAYFNCEATCCGNVACLSQVLFGKKLFSSDPITPLVKTLVWEGQATYTVDLNNAYAQKGIAVGHLIDAFLKFDLNSFMGAWNIRI